VWIGAGRGPEPLCLAVLALQAETRYFRRIRLVVVGVSPVSHRGYRNDYSLFADFLRRSMNFLAMVDVVCVNYIVASFHRIRLVSADLHSYLPEDHGPAHISARRSAQVVKIEIGNAGGDAGNPPGTSNILDLRSLPIKDPFRVWPAVVARLLGFKKKIFPYRLQGWSLAALPVLSFV
jgi:hypothetical protein